MVHYLTLRGLVRETGVIRYLPQAVSDGVHSDLMIARISLRQPILSRLDDLTGYSMKNSNSNYSNKSLNKNLNKQIE
jgi:hypothetical protein